MRRYLARLDGAPLSFSTLRCGSWIDAGVGDVGGAVAGRVSVPFDAGRGLMHELR